ncbi:MAG: ABC transporter permease [Bdellovibrionales bacterium]
MNMKFRIALRNVLRNRRRTILNVTMIASGIAAMVVFRGFAHNLTEKLQWVAIKTQYGHLQIANNKTWNPSASDAPKDHLIQIDPAFKAKIDGLKEVAYSSGRLTFFGLINNGENSLSARGVGFDPGVEKQMLGSMRMISGHNLTGDSKFEMILGKGLRDQMGIADGSQMTLMAYTFDGSINAVDVELVGTFQSGLAEVDNSTFFVPLTTAQKLLDTDSIERLVIQLNQTQDTPAIKALLSKDVPAGMAIKAWNEMALYYQQVVEYFNMQNMVIQWILMLLALLAIGNIVGMSIAERTGEIGTVRAIGNSRLNVITQFLIEGFILGILGGVFGCILGYWVAKFLNVLRIPIVTPGASLPIPLEVDILPKVFGDAMIAMCLMAVLATLIPAIRASRIEIVEALKRNI